MTNKTIGIWALCTIVFLLGCKKETLPDLGESNAPIYHLKGSLNGDDFVFDMEKSDISVNYGVEEINGMTAHFGSMEATNSGEKIKISVLANEKRVINNNFNVFQDQNIPFLIHEKGRVQFDFGGIGNQNNYMYLQDKNGNFVKTDVLEIPQFGKININAVFYDFGNNTFEFAINHGFQQHLLLAEFQVSGEGDTLKLSPIQDNYIDEWYVDDILVGTKALYKGHIEDGIHVIKHIVMDKDGNSAEAYNLVRYKGGKNFWTMKMNYLPTYEFEPYNFGRPIVSVYKNNEWYSTDLSTSNKTNSMSVTKINVIPNEIENKPLVGFDLEFSAYLANANATDSIFVENMEGRFYLGLK